jgi:hypothetical protein
LQKNPDLRPRASEALIAIDQLLIECSVTKSRRKKYDDYSNEVSETGFSGNVLSVIEKSRPKRSLIFQVKLSPVVHLVQPLLFPPHHVIQMQKTRNEVLLLTSQGTVLLGVNNRPIKIMSDLYGKHIVKIALGNGFMFFLTDKGLLLGKGDPKSHCMARYLESSGRSMDYVHFPEVIESLFGVDVIDISTFIDHTIICSSEGHSYSWGYNRSGCLGIGDDCTSPVLIPIPVVLPSSSKVTAVFTGKNSTVLLDEKKHPWVCGSNSSRKLGLDSPDDVYFPQKLSWISESVTSVSLGDNATCFLFGDGSITVLGRSFRETSFTRRVLPKSFLPKISFSGRANRVCCASQFFLSMTQDNELFFWGQRKKNVKQSESHAFYRAKSLVSDYLEKEDIIVGEADQPLIDIVGQVGPDCPVLLLKEPQVRLNEVKDIRKFRSDEEIIQEPNLVVALYSSQIHLKAGESISFGDIVCFGDDEVYLILETNCQKDSVSRRILPTTNISSSSQVTDVPSPTTSEISPTLGTIPNWIIKEFDQPLVNEKTTRIQEIPMRNLSPNAGHRSSQSKEELLSSLRKQNMQLQQEIMRLRTNEASRKGKKTKLSFIICCYPK